MKCSNAGATSYQIGKVCGGYAAVMGWWGKNNIEPPVLLANHDNAAILDSITLEGNIDIEAQAQAFEKTTRGAIKASQLARAILNNKFDKKGHYDTFRWWWAAHVGTDFTFPDTSNNQFQSHCEAAVVILLYLPHFIQFLQHIHDKKQNA
jgi:hypothetical protein